MLEMINATLFTLAEGSINAVLQQDPVTLSRMQQLSGNVIQIQLQDPDFHFALLPNAEGLQLHSQLGTEADVTLTGTPAAFIKLLTSKDKAEAMFGQGVTVTGKNALATQLQEILADTQIDWEAQLAQLMGDLPAHQLANLMRFKTSQYRTIGGSLLDNIEEYIREESELLAPKPMVRQFMTEVDQLRMATDRLEARFQQLRSKIHND